MPSAVPASTSPTMIDRRSLVPRAGQIAQHRLAAPDHHAGLFLRFAAAHVFDAFAGFDHTRHHFQQPWRITGIDRGDAQLFNQYHFVAHRIVGQQHRRMAALENFTRDFRAHFAIEQAMAKPV